MLKLNNTTYKQEVKTDKRDELSCVIGDDKSLDFEPQMKIERFSNECNVSIRLIETADELKETATIVEENGKIKHIKSKREAHFYELPVSEEHREGASEFEIILKEKPKTNIVQFSVVDKDVDYFYQPALTPEEIAEGASRPENVVGSYAVYAKTPKANYVRGKEYKCGKIGHIYRPKIIDSAGTEVWGDLKIENGILSVTIPQDFLDNAVYPVRHAAGLTFGRTTAGGTASSMAADRLQGSVFTSPAGTNQIESLTMYGSANSPGNNAKGVVVLNSNLNIITNGIGNAVLLTSSVGWRTSTLSTPAAISASTDYALMAVGTGDGIYVYYDATGGVHQNDNTNSYASPINPTDATGGTRYFSIYATYTAAGGGTVQPNHLMSLMGCGN